MNRPALLACTLALSLTAPGLGAQDPEVRWYRVELLIFSHQGSGAATSEAWDPLPALRYPERFRFLRDLERETSDREAWPDAQSTIDERGVHTIVVPETADDDSDRLAAQNIPATDNSDPAVTGIADEELPPARPTPWVMLPATQLEFRGKAAYMERSGRYETLLHESWVQPMSGDADSLPIVIDRSGDVENWPRLQGSVRFYLSRYLHLETNLWLNTAGNYIPGSWSMPAPPLGPKSLQVIEPKLEPEPLPESRYDGLMSSEPDDDTGDSQAQLALDEPRYPWRHAVILSDKRRMRSEEVHYLDHPMLGVVVKITPLPEEALEAMAADEAAASQ